MSNPSTQFGRPMQAGIQESVHFFDIGTGQRAVRGLLLTVATGVLMMFYAGNQFRGLNQPEAMDQAQLGRNLLRGEGYTTRFIRPISMWRLDQQSRWHSQMLGRHPDLMNPPVYPALIGAFLYLVQKGDMWPPDEARPTIKEGQPKPPRVLMQEILSWGYWTQVWAGLAMLWVLWVVQRAWRGRVKRGETPWHVAGILTCVVMMGVLWAPRTSFRVEVEEAFTLFGPDRWIVYGLGIPLSLLNGGLVYLIGQRLFDRRVGITAACLLMLSETTCQYAISGLNVTLVITWVGLASLCLVTIDEWRSEARRPYGAVLLALMTAIFMGLAFLTKYAAGWLLVPVCLYCWRLWGWWRGAWLALAMAIVFFAVSGPWLARNYWMGSGFLGLAAYGVVENIDVFRGNALERMLDPSFRSVTLGRIWTKALVNAHDLWIDSPWVIGTGIAMAFFAAALFYKFRRPQVNRFKWFTVGGAALMFVVTCFVGAEPRPEHSLAQAGNLVMLIAPLMTMFAAALFYVLLDRLPVHVPIWRGTIIALFLGATALPMLLRLAGPPADRYAYPPYYPPKLAQAAGYLDQREFMMSDQPWAVAWYGDRRCIWLPVTPEELYKINDFNQHISAMLLTPVTLNARFLTEIALSEWQPWAPIILRRQIPATFPLQAGYSIEGVNMIFIADRKRWPDPPAPAAARR